MQSILTHFAEELPISLCSSERAHTKYSSSVQRKECSDAVKLACEDLENYKSKAKLAQRGANVRAFKGALRSSDLNKFLVAENDAAGPMGAQMVCVGRMTGL